MISIVKILGIITSVFAAYPYTPLRYPADIYPPSKLDPLYPARSDPLLGRGINAAERRAAAGLPPYPPMI